MIFLDASTVLTNLSHLPVAFFALTFLPWAVQAQSDGTTELRAAEQALVNIDFEKAGQLAEKALRTGRLTDPADTSRARYLMGVGEAYKENNELAKENFRIAISINPDLPVDSSLGPKLQSPFLEAKGELAVRKEYLGAKVTVQESKTGPAVAVALADPTRVAKKVSVELRPKFYESDAQAEFRSEQAAVTRTNAELSLDSFGLRDRTEIEDDITSFDLVVTVHDQYGNVIHKIGSQKLPENRANPYFSEPTAFEELVSSPLFWIGTVAFVGAAGGLIYAYAIAPPERVGVVSAPR